MGSFPVVVVQVGVEVLLHLLNGLVPGLAALDPEMLVQQRPVKALDKAVALWPANFGGTMLDPFELQEQLVGVPVGAPAKLAAIVGEDRGDGRFMLVEEGEHVFVEHVNSSDRQLASVEPAPGVAGIAVDDRLQVDAAHALQCPDKEGIDRHQIAGVPRFDVPLPELGGEKGTDLFLWSPIPHLDDLMRFLTVREPFPPKKKAAPIGRGLRLLTKSSPKGGDFVYL